MRSQVTDARDGSSRTVRQFQFIDWPEQGVPKSGEGFIDFIGQVHKTKEQFGQDGPITVHCSAGVGRTGVFITLSIVLERMQYEGVLDVFQTVRILRAQRPAMVQTEVNILSAYKYVCETYLLSTNHFSAFICIHRTNINSVIVPHWNISVHSIITQAKLVKLAIYGTLWLCDPLNFTTHKLPIYIYI